MCVMVLWRKKRRTTFKNDLDPNADAGDDLIQLTLPDHTDRINCGDDDVNIT